LQVVFYLPVRSLPRAKIRQIHILEFWKNPVSPICIQNVSSEQNRKTLREKEASSEQNKNDISFLQQNYKA
jgi:hypothetical protein